MTKDNKKVTVAKEINWSGNVIRQPVVPFESNDIDITLLEDFAKIRVIDNEIWKINNEKDNYTLFVKSPQTATTIKKNVEAVIKNSIASFEASLVSTVEHLQMGAPGSMGTGVKDVGRAVTTTVVVDILEKLVSYKNLLKYLSLVPDKTSVKGISEEVRKSKVAECNGRTQELEKTKGEFFPRGQHQWYNEISRKVDRWEAVAKQFGKPVDTNGSVLKDERWLKVYCKLGFDVMPKHKLRQPVFIDGKEYEFHPGFKR